MSQPPLNALRAFEAVARLGSFRAAAEALCVTQSAVSHQMRHLEDWLGGSLFERGGNRPRLLPHGEELARALSLSLSEIEAACQRARSHGESQPLVIAAIPSIAICWLIPRLSDFRARHPEVEIRLVYALHGRDVDFRDVHLAFVFAAPPERPGVRAEPFLPGASVPVCAPALLDRLGTDRPTPMDMLDLGLLHDTDVSGWRSWMTKAGHTGAIPTGGPVFEDFNLLRAAALAGQGVALCPLAMIRPDLDARRLVQLSDRTVQEELGYWLLSGPAAGTLVAREAQVFRDWAFATRSGGES